MELVDMAAEKQIYLLMETGQESAENPRDLLEELNHPALKVNLDPGNMIPYNKNNPVDALKILSLWVKQIHAKDAVRIKVARTWGKEVPWGQGQVNGNEFFEALKQIGFDGAIVIEREVGEKPLEDIKLAIDNLKSIAS